MKRFTYWLKEKLWLSPAIYIGIAVALSIAFFYVDLLLVDRFKEFIPSILLTNVELARTIMGGLSSALLTMTTFTFSTILVVLTMYSSQFSPRTLKNFIHDRLTWRVLGIFLGGFIYNTLSLLFMRDDLYETDILSAFVGILIAFFCLATFAYFIHYIATLVQVGKLVTELEEDTEQVISNYKELQADDSRSPSSWQPSGIKETVVAEKSGYLQFLSFERMSKYAKEQEILIEFDACIGDYLFEGKPIFHIYKTAEKDLSFDRFYSVGNERTSEQDLDFALQKLVEVALRAISPGINDPNTANEIILKMGRLLGKVGHLKTGPFALEDNDGNPHLLYTFPSYPDVLYKTFYQLAHYGRQDISVLTSITKSLTAAAQMGPDKYHPDIWDIQLYLLEDIQNQHMKKLDLQQLQKKVDVLAEATGQRALNILSDNFGT
ncbi:MAG TPA: DUF2254 domain-containing protein [Planococcus sp. (in: firmicutes)]|nr:DUF2254 domain-containing protein [Planococcus sp. (in: firmicutes)]